MPVQISTSQSVAACAESVFRAATEINARELIRQHGPLPAIINVSGHDAPWSEVGQIRTHRLSDNSSIREELVAFTPHQTFAYRLSDFTGPFSALTREAHAEWHFTATGATQTQIDWTYIFHPSGPVAEPLLWFFVKIFWPGYLKSALLRVKERAERQSR